MRMILFVMLLSLVLLSGCFIYGSGKTVGYIYAVDDGLIWDKVWYKSNLESSESDCYLIQNENIKQELTQLIGNTKIELTYNRHLITASICGGEGQGTNDEIISYKIIR